MRPSGFSAPSPFLSEAHLAYKAHPCSCPLVETMHGSLRSGHKHSGEVRVMVRTPDISLQGVVVFFPSFAYADQVFGHWQATGALERLGHRKHVFREPRSAVEVESVLR